MLDREESSKLLVKLLDKKPNKVERFEIAEKITVDFLQFEDRPFEGVSSIITSGVSNVCELNPVEFIITFNTNSIDADTDLSAFLATYIQFHYLVNCHDFSDRDFFSLFNTLIKGYDYTGVYATHPCYFPTDTFATITNTQYLWLIPIFQNEYEFIERAGVEDFERYLEKEDPDMTIFNREPLPV